MVKSIEIFKIDMHMFHDKAIPWTALAALAVKNFHISKTHNIRNLMTKLTAYWSQARIEKTASKSDNYIREFLTLSIADGENE